MSIITCLTHQLNNSNKANPCYVQDMKYFCSLAYYSAVCYDLDPWVQGQALRVFLSQNVFSTILSEVYIGFGSNL